MGKKSAKGLLKVIKNNNEYELVDQVTKEEEQTGELQTVFINGKLTKECSLQEIRQRISQYSYYKGAKNR